MSMEKIEIQILSVLAINVISLQLLCLYTVITTIGAIKRPNRWKKR